MSLSETLAALHRFGPIDPSDLRQIDQLGSMLQGLASDPAFLTQWLAEQLLRPESFQADNPYHPRSLVLANGERWRLRVCLWFPERGGDHVEDRMNAYGQTGHDHTFSFITVGLSGPGYTTERWGLDRGQVRRANIGDALTLTPLGVSVLSPGEVRFYPAFDVAHQQLAPPELSLSLNLLMYPDDFGCHPQTLFDPVSGLVVGQSETRTDRERFLARLADALQRR